MVRLKLHKVSRRIWVWHQVSVGRHQVVAYTAYAVTINNRPSRLRNRPDQFLLSSILKSSLTPQLLVFPTRSLEMESLRFSQIQLRYRQMRSQHPQLCPLEVFQNFMTLKHNLCLGAFLKLSALPQS